MPAAASQERGQLRSALVREWRDIGGLGRIALLGVIAAGGLAVGLGFSITSAARGHLLDARADILSGITAELATSFSFPVPSHREAAFDQAVRELLLGGETLRVKVWLRDGTVAYSDDETLVGERFDLSRSALEAFAGEQASQVSDLSEPTHAEHRDLGSLIEFYLPFSRQGPEVESVFEIEQRTDLLEGALGRIERNVWLSIGGGLAALGVFLGALVLAQIRDLNQRRLQAEAVLGDSLRVQEQERRRIVGSLHDDVGQPLYRLLYGLGGTAGRMSKDDPLRTELESMTDLVHQIDVTLRAELRMLHRGLLADLGLETALTELVETIEKETDLEVSLRIALDRDPGEVARGAIFRAAAEALTNVRRHAHATRAEVSVILDHDDLVLTVKDNGSGRRIKLGLGLTTTRDRLESIGGSLQVSGGAGSGTVFRATVPTTAAAEEIR